MKKIVVTLGFLILSAAVCHAQPDDKCFERCLSKSTSQNDSSKKYCEEKCSRVEDPYAKLQMDIQKESLELQKQQLELQKQTLELQKEMLELQKKSQAQAAAPEEKVIEVEQE